MTLAIFMVGYLIADAIRPVDLDPFSILLMCIWFLVHDIIKLAKRK